MVYHRITYYCSTCHESHHTAEEASSCEGDHIVENAVSNFKATLDTIMSNTKVKIKARKKKA